MAVILYTAHGERGLLSEGLDCGARGYVLKDAPPDDIVQRRQAGSRRRCLRRPTLASELVSPKATERLPALSTREREILGLLANGFSNPGDRIPAVHQPRDGSHPRAQRDDQARGRYPHASGSPGAAPLPDRMKGLRSRETDDDHGALLDHMLRTVEDERSLTRPPVARWAPAGADRDPAAGGRHPPRARERRDASRPRGAGTARAAGDRGRRRAAPDERRGCIRS